MRRLGGIVFALVLVAACASDGGDVATDGTSSSSDDPGSSLVDGKLGGREGRDGSDDPDGAGEGESCDCPDDTAGGNGSSGNGGDGNGSSGNGSNAGSGSGGDGDGGGGSTPGTGPGGSTTVPGPGATTTTWTLPPTTPPPGTCQVARPLSNTTTLTTGGSAAGARVDRGGVGLIIGHSNGVQIGTAFDQQAAAASSFPWVNGAKGSNDAEAWATRNEPWDEADDKLAREGWAPEDVQVVVAIISHRAPDPRSIEPINQFKARDWPAIMARLERRYPNLQLVYLAPRESARFAPPGTANGEPSAHNHNVAAVELASAYRGRATMIAGPYLWDDGSCLRADGLRTGRENYVADGIHPSSTGSAYLAGFMVQYFLHHPSSTAWFPRR
jgi:hypothetical protein